MYSWFLDPETGKTAEKLEQAFSACDYDSDSDCYHGEDVEGFLSLCEGLAESVTFPYGTNSLDPTRLYEFGDGSKLWVSNPGQQFYCTSVTAVV